jgi:sulfite exporter TauE/SafE
MAQSALVAAFVAGLVGGLHCIAMCGGFVTALSANAVHPRTVEILHARKLLVGQTISNIARILTYGALGAIFGGLGAAALGTEWILLQRMLYVVANVLLLLLAYAVATGRSPFAALERVGLAAYRRLIPAAGRLMREGSAASRFGLGLLWGLTPCGLVYSVLPVAMLAGSAADGALVMLLFGLGTLPNLLAAGFVLGRAQRWLRGPAWRVAGAAAIVAFALAGLYRAWFVPEALAHGPFCIVP